MAIGTPTIVGSIGNASTPTSLAITTTGAIAAHDLVVVWHYANATNSTAASVTDTAGNTYVRLFSLTAAAPLYEVYVCWDAIAMATTNAITIPSFTPSTSLRHGMYAINVTGIVRSAGAFDPHTGQFEKSTGTSSPSTPVLNSASTTMLLLGTSLAGTALGTYTPGSGWTALTALTTNAFMYPTYQIVSTNAPISLAPSWTASIVHGTQSLGFLALPATNTSRQGQMSMMGVGA